jgi:hypothetical protein
MESIKNEKPNTPFKMLSTQINVFSSKDINSVGGIEEFSKLIGNDKPIPVPTIEFSDEEWSQMEELLKEK